MFKKVSPLVLGIIAIVLSVLAVFIYNGSVLSQPQGNRTFTSPSLAQNNVCLMYQAYGELYHTQLGRIAEAYYISDYDIVPDNSFLVFSGGRSLGRDVGSVTDEQGNVYGWDTELREDGVFKYDFATQTVTPIWLEDGFEIQGAYGVAVSQRGDYVIFSAGNYGPNTGGDEELFLVVVATGEVHQLTNNFDRDLEPDWSGTQLTWTTTTDNYVIAVGSILNYALTDVSIIAEGGMQPSFSPDGREIAYYGRGITLLDTANRYEPTTLESGEENWFSQPSIGLEGQLFFSNRIDTDEMLTFGNMHRSANYMQIWGTTATGEVAPLIGIRDRDLTNPQQISCQQ